MKGEWPVLTVRQPWCWAIENGKPVENRSRNMKYRGPLWLHAGARSRWDPAGEASPLVQMAWNKFIGPVSSLNRWMGTKNVTLCRDNSYIRFGAVSSLAEVTGCHHADDCGVTVPERPWLVVMCTPWSAEGQWHIELADIRPLAEPVPCRGMLGLWRLPDDVEKAVRAQLSEEP